MMERRPEEGYRPVNERDRADREVRDPGIDPDHPLPHTTPSRRHPVSPRYTDPHVDDPRHRPSTGKAFSADEPIGRRGNEPGLDRHDTSPAEIGRIRERGSTMASTGAATPRDEIDKVLPGPGHTEAVDEQVRERMEEESPDGRPPTLRDRKKSRTLFYGVLAVVWIVVISAVTVVGGWAMAALVLLLTALYIGYASWPVWRAALERQADERRAEREVEMEMHPDSPADRQPPAQNR